MIRYLQSGDSAVILKVGNDISKETNVRVRKILNRIDSEPIHGIIDLIPSYNEVMVCFDPLERNSVELIEELMTLEADYGQTLLPSSKSLIIPVLYGGDYGPDLEFVASTNNLDADRAAAIHSSASYLVYMLGFTPGFCYLGGLDCRIVIPRKKEPRLRVPAGSVGIAGDQTGIYSVESPGGWQIIGRTPVNLFDPGRDPVFLFNPGDTVKFRPVHMLEYNRIIAEIAEGKWTSENIIE
jgi:KipI family sensor histidine kinase inhibitor